MAAQLGFWRVYKEEWAVVYVSESDGDAGTEECLERASEVMPPGEFLTGGWRISAWSVKDPGNWPSCLEVLIPVMKGEYQDGGDAAEHARGIEGFAVREGSAQDREAQRLNRPTTRHSG